jgi:monovalent cation:H+ antiporter, CPA1 family
VHREVAFVLLFSIATAVAIATRRLRVPYTVALVLAGLVLGSLPIEPRLSLTRDLLFAIVLPGLIFEAGLHLREEWLTQTRASIVALAVPGVVAALGLTAWILVKPARAFAPAFAFLDALVFAATTVATDPIAVVATFRSLSAPTRLAVLVEGESLLNDGTGVVVFNLVVAAAMGQITSIPGAVWRFLLVSAGGALVGLVFASVLVQVLRRVDDPMIEITLTVIAAYGSFAVGEQLGVSGVIATVAAGLVCGRAARAGIRESSSVTALRTFWEYVAFALNSVVFLLIGMDVRLSELLADWRLILLAYAVVTLVRFAIVFATTAAFRRTREAIPWRWSLVLGWSGLRGALAMVLALSIPPLFPARGMIIHMTFGVVVLSIIVQGLTVGPLLRVLGINAEASESPR